MNGTHVNDQLVGRQLIHNKDRIRIAFTEFILVTDLTGKLAKTSVMVS